MRRFQRFIRPNSHKARQSNVNLEPPSSSIESPGSAVIETQPPSQLVLSDALKEPARVRDLWAEAVQQLSEEARIVLQSPSASKLDLLQDLRAAADQKRQDCDNRRLKIHFNGKEIVLRDLTDKVVVWINKFKEIGDLAVNFDPVHAALPWAGVRFLLQMATAENQQRGALLIGCEKVAYLISRCTIYEILYIQDRKLAHATAPAVESLDWANQSGRAAQNLESALVTLYTAILRFLVEANKLYKSFGVRVIHGFLQPDQMVGFVKECEALESRVETEASNCERIYSRTAHAKLDENRERLEQLLVDLQEPILRTDARVAAIEIRLNESERIEMLNWISHIQYEKNHHTACEGRTPGTGQWLLVHSRYQTWRESSSSKILWLHGIPGAGKTKLVTTVVDDLLGGVAQHSKNEALAYFYCDRNQADRRDPSLILNSLVRQLSTPVVGGPVQPLVEQLYIRKREAAFASGTLHFEESREILLQLADCYSQITLVLDALDECNGGARRQLLDTFDLLVDHPSRRFKIFISSRPDGDIKRRFGDGLNMEIKATDNRHDIVKFVDDKIENSTGWQEELTPALKKEIRETLVDKSEGMFQWVSLQIGQLLELLPLEGDIRDRLGKLPDTLEKAYDEIYARIRAQKGSAPGIANRAFQWVMCSITPLSPAELVAAISQDPETDTIGSAITKIDFVLTACNNLLVVDLQSGVCRLSHLSVQEYFETRHWDQIQANGLVAKVCLSILSNPLRIQGMSDIVPYARLHWPTHIQRHNQERTDDRLALLLKRFHESLNESGPAYRSWHKTIITFYKTSNSFVDSDDIPLRQGWRYPPEPPVSSDSTPLYGLFKELIPSSVASFGFHKILLDWWVSPTNANQQNNYCKTLLQLAAAGGSVSVVEELLEKGANTNATDKNGATALHFAATNGHEKIISLLLDRGAELDFKSRYGQTPLSWTAGSGNEVVVKMLLAKGAELDTKDEYGQTPLLRAARNGHETIVKCLIDRGAEIDVIDKNGRTPLSHAAECGHEVVVEMLLDKGAELDTKDEFSRSPLSWALQNNYGHIIRLLVRRGAEQDGGDRNGRTPLLQAAEFQQEQIVGVLIDELISRGSNLSEHLGADQKSILHWAAIADWSELIQMAVEKARAKVDQIDTSGRTPLHYAAENGNTGAARQLIELGSSVRIRDNAGRTAIQVAASEGFSDTLIFLLRKSDYDINQPDNVGCTLLHWIATLNLPGIMKFLVGQPGVNLSARNGYGRTAMHIAALCGCPDVLRVFLALDHYDINQPDAFGNTLLHLGARGGSLEVVTELIQYPTFDQNRQNKFGQTALDTADVYDKSRKVFTFLREAQLEWGTFQSSRLISEHHMPAPELQTMPEDLSKALTITPLIPTPEN